MATKKPPAPKPSPAPKTKTVVATRASTAIGESMLDQMINDAGAGLEGMGREDLAIPMLSILQPMSPQVTPGKAEYIDGASPGDIYNNVTLELYTEIRVVPVAYRRTLIEWWPRDSKQGKGFVREHSIDSDILEHTTRNEKNMDMLPGGTYIANTTQHYCLLLDDEGGAPQQVVISMTSTQLKKARKWNTMMKMKTLTDPKSGRTFPAPMFAFVWKLGSSLEQNDKGSWYGWTIEEDGPMNDAALYSMAKSFSESIRQGLVKVKLDDEAAESAQTADAPY